MKKIVATLLAIALVLTSVVSFAEVNNNVGQGLYTGSSEAGAIHAMITTMSVMNPIKQTYSNEFSINRHIWDCLVKSDSETNQTVPAAAESWTVSEDGLTWTFNLRQGQYWVNSKGEKVAEVTAKDFVFGWSELQNPSNACEYAEFPQAIDTAVALDDYTLQVTLKYYVGYFLQTVKFEVMVPIYEPFYTEVGADNYGTSPETLLYNGPFYMTEWKLENSVVIEKNPYWYNADQVELQKIYWDKYTDTNTRLNAFMAGELDVCDLTGEQLELMKADGYEAISYNGGYSYWYWVNVTDETMSNLNLRQAISAALDRTTIINTVLKDSSEPSQCATLGISGVNTDTFGEAVVAANGGSLYNPVADADAASTYLAAAMAEMGVTDASQISVTLLTSEGTQNEMMSALVQEMLQKTLGITVEIDVQTITEARRRRNALEFQMFFGGWGPDYNDPKTDLELFTSTNGNNHTGYANPEYDALIEATDSELDATAREQLFIQAELMVQRDLPVIPIYWKVDSYVVSEKMVSGFARLPFQAYNLIYTKLAK